MPSATCIKGDVLPFCNIFLLFEDLLQKLVVVVMTWASNRKVAKCLGNTGSYFWESDGWGL